MRRKYDNIIHALSLFVVTFVAYSIVSPHLDLKTKYKVALLNHDYLIIFNLYKKNRLYTNLNIKQLQIIIQKWKEVKNKKVINNSWLPKKKPFNREILLF